MFVTVLKQCNYPAYFWKGQEKCFSSRAFLHYMHFPGAFLHSPGAFLNLVETFPYLPWPFLHLPAPPPALPGSTAPIPPAGRSQGVARQQLSQQRLLLTRSSQVHTTTRIWIIRHAIGHYLKLPGTICHLIPNVIWHHLHLKQHVSVPVIWHHVTSTSTSYLTLLVIHHYMSSTPSVIWNQFQFDITCWLTLPAG